MPVSPPDERRADGGAGVVVRVARAGRPARHPRRARLPHGVRDGRGGRLVPREGARRGARPSRSCSRAGAPPGAGASPPTGCRRRGREELGDSRREREAPRPLEREEREREPELAHRRDAKHGIGRDRRAGPEVGHTKTPHDWLSRSAVREAEGEPWHAATRGDCRDRVLRLRPRFRGRGGPQRRARWALTRGARHEQRRDERDHEGRERLQSPRRDRVPLSAPGSVRRTARRARPWSRPKRARRTR